MQELTGQQIDSDVIEIILSESSWQGSIIAFFTVWS